MPKNGISKVPHSSDQMTPLMRIVFMGTPSFAVPSLHAIIKAGYAVTGVVTQPDKPSGRGMATRPSPVKEAALGYGIEVFEPKSVRTPEFTAALKSLSPDIIVVIAYGKILPKDILGIPPKGCINVHSSLLPGYRGAAPINWAIINGEKTTGVCTMLLDEGMDTGDVLLKAQTPILDDETAEGLAQRLSIAGADLIIKTLELASKGALTPVKQDNSKASSAPILKKEDGRIDWNKDAVSVYNLIRGVYPWPGAYTHSGAKVIKIHGGRVAAESHGDKPGRVADISRDGITVACGRGSFIITELQPENKKRMSAFDFIQGYRLKKGDSFE